MKYCCKQMKSVIKYPAKMNTGNSILSLKFNINYDVKMTVSDEFNYFDVYFSYCPFCGVNLRKEKQCIECLKIFPLNLMEQSYDGKYKYCKTCFQNMFGDEGE